MRSKIRFLILLSFVLFVGNGGPTRTLAQVTVGCQNADLTAGPCRTGNERNTPARREPRTSSGPKNYPHVQRDASGRLSPEPGYHWVNAKDKHDYRVEPIPSNLAGQPHPRYANVVYTEDGQIRPADGYMWLNPEAAAKGKDFRVKSVPRHRAGQPHEKLPHVVYGDNEELFPAAGYTWVDPKRAELGVRSLTESERDVALAVQAVRRGNDFWKQRLYTEAESQYRQATQLDPQNARVRNDLGATLYMLSKPEEAYQALHKALELDPNNGFAHTWLAFTAVELFDRATDKDGFSARLNKALAIQEGAEAVKLRPTDYFAHEAFAQALTRGERFDEAEREYIKALSMQPANNTVREEYAGSMLDKSAYWGKRGYSAEAAAAASKTLELSNDPKRRATAYNNLGLAHLHDGRFAEAEQALNEALKLDPAYQNAQRNLARVRSAQAAASDSSASTQVPLQPFPAGGSAAIPNTGQPASSSSEVGGSTSPKKQGQVTQHYGTQAAGSSTPEDSGGAARVGFDVPGAAVSGSDPVNAPRRIKPEDFPISVQNDPRVRKEREKLQTLQDEVKPIAENYEKVKQERERTGASPTVQEYQLKNQVDEMEKRIHEQTIVVVDRSLAVEQETLQPTDKRSGPQHKEGMNSPQKNVNPPDHL